MRLVTFLDNHDQPRFMSIGGATTDRLNVALAFLYTARGVPCLYYGTEQAFNGTTDPNDREDMFAGQFEQGPSLGDNFNMTHPQFQMVAKLNNFRRLYPALQTGSHANKWNDPDGPGLFAYARRLGKRRGLRGLQHLHVHPDAHQPPDDLRCRHADRQPVRHQRSADGDGDAGDSAGHRAGHDREDLRGASDWKPLDPVVVSNSPAHDAASVPTYSPIVLQFSQPMDTEQRADELRHPPAGQRHVRLVSGERRGDLHRRRAGFRG